MFKELLVILVEPLLLAHLKMTDLTRAWEMPHSAEQRLKAKKPRCHILDAERGL